MGKIQRVLTIGLFALLNGFLLGLVFLFVINVPLEALLTWAKATQQMIDFTMRLLIGFWVLSSILLTITFYKVVLTDRNAVKIAVKTILVLIILSSVSVPVLIYKNESPLAFLNGSIASTGQKVSFGPYPEEEQIRELKDEGYTGIITLLNPTIPFEKVLLDKEIAYGKQIGLEVYSFPMLPWVSDNKAQLEQLKTLVNSTKGKFYAHCYLGKHRVKLVQQALASDPAQARLSNAIFYPDQLERGWLYNYRNAQIFLGPYPTDAEWENFVLRSQIKEIISLLDPDNPEDKAVLEKERATAEQMGVLLKNFPLRQKSLAEDAAKLVMSLKILDHKVYIHSYLMDARVSMLDGYFRNGTLAQAAQDFPDRISTGPVYQVNHALILGPTPDEKDIMLLHSKGVANIISTEAEANQPIGQIVNNLQRLISNNPGVDYVYGFTSDEQARSVYTALSNRFYGMKRQDIPNQVAGTSVEFINGKLLVGSPPSQQETNNLAALGVNTVVYVSGRGTDDPKAIKQLQETAGANGMNMVAIKYAQSYEADIADQVLRDNNLVYVAVPQNALMNITQDLMELRPF